MEIQYTAHFVRSYRKLPRAIKQKAERQELLFRANPFHPKLHTHKLNGKLTRFYSFSIDQKYRIVFSFIKTDKVVFLDVGDHIVYR